MHSELARHLQYIFLYHSRGALEGNGGELLYIKEISGFEMAIALGVIRIETGYLDNRFDPRFLWMLSIVMNRSGEFVELAMGATNQMTNAKGHARVLRIDLIYFAPGSTDEQYSHCCNAHFNVVYHRSLLYEDLSAIFLEYIVELLFVNRGPVQLAATKQWHKKRLLKFFTPGA